MARRPIIWLCLADGEHVKILTQGEDGRDYMIVNQVDSAQAHRNTRALATDRLPRTQESANTARHAIAPRVDLHWESKARFMRLIADHLNGASERGECDVLILVAPSRCLRVLKAGLKPGTLRRVSASMAKDLTKVPVAKLPRDLITTVSDKVRPGTRRRRLATERPRISAQ